MFSDTGPVTIIPSAWRGEGAMSIPNLPISKFTFEQAFNSISQALHPPADTDRSFKDRPKNFFRSFRVWTAVFSYDFKSVCIFTISFSRDVDDILYRFVNFISFFLQAFSQSAQNMHLPISMDKGVDFTAPVGQTDSTVLSADSVAIYGMPLNISFIFAVLMSGIAWLP